MHREVGAANVRSKLYPTDFHAVFIIGMIDHITNEHALRFGGIDQGRFRQYARVRNASVCSAL